MHEVDDRGDSELLDQVGDDLIGPAPVELAGLKRLDAVPGHAPANHLEAEVTDQSQILPPMFVMAHELVFIQRAVPRSGLGHKGVLDTGCPEEIFRTAQQGV